MKKEKLLSRRVPRGLLESTARQYRENKISMERAAGEAGVSLRAMMGYLRQKKIPLQYDVEDFERDLKGIYQRLSEEKHSD